MTKPDIAASIKATAMPAAMVVNDLPSSGGTAAYINDTYWLNMLEILTHWRRKKRPPFSKKHFLIFANVISLYRF